jgi:hypothetical protein
VAIFFFGDPRVRSSYDVFGLALLAAPHHRPVRPRGVKEKTRL